MKINAEWTFEPPMTPTKLGKVMQAFEGLVQRAYKDCGIDGAQMTIVSASVKDGGPADRKFSIELEIAEEAVAGYLWALLKSIADKPA